MKTLGIGTLLHGKLEYKIDKCLGQGGFGITYLATGEVQLGNIKHHLPFTIKEFFIDSSCTRSDAGEMLVTAGLEADVAEHKKEFLREAERLNKLDNHQGIVSVNEIFHQNNTVYYVMEYLGDVNLETYTKKQGGILAEDEALRIFRNIAEALAFLHDKKITHLDVKPANVMMRDVEGDIIPVLIDFGLAVHYGKKGDPTRENKMICCSDGYSPLEQYLGISTFSPEADVYALGATLLYMLTGKKPPVASEINNEYIDRELAGRVSANSMAVLKKCMGKLSEQRYHSLHDLLAELGTESVPVEEPAEPDNGEHTRVMGRKAERKPVKISMPDLSNMKKPALIIAALAVIGALSYGIANFIATLPSSQSSDETVDTTAVVTDTVKAAESVAETAEPADVQKPVVEAEEKEKTAQPSEEKPQKEKVKEEKPDSKPSSSQDETSSTPAKQSSSSLDLGYARYEGPVVNGKPDGHGVLTFTSEHVVDSYDSERRMASPGDKLQGKFKRGHFSMGKWIKANGEVETLMIGN